MSKDTESSSQKSDFDRRFPKEVAVFVKYQITLNEQQKFRREGWLAAKNNDLELLMNIPDAWENDYWRKMISKLQQEIIKVQKELNDE